MYYGNAGAPNQQNIPGAWDSNYVAVWHFDNNTLDDSTSNGYDGTNTGTTYNSNCKINGGREYEGNHRIDVNNFATISTDLTLEAWVYRDSGDSQSFIRLFTEGPDWNDNDWCIYWRTQQGGIRFIINSADFRTGGDFNDSGTWFHIVITYESGDVFLYKNGKQQKHWIGYGASIGDSYTTLTIGNQNNGGRPWDGKMDEVRISNINRSENWINTSYNSMNSPDMFYFFGNEEGINTVNITLVNTGSSAIKTSDVTILINGTVTSFACSTTYIYPNRQANFDVALLSTGEKRIKIVTGNGISDYFIFEGL
jgi:archaellum component FlaF (FlaF/FlaG flagellin family)